MLFALLFAVVVTVEVRSDSAPVTAATVSAAAATAATDQNGIARLTVPPGTVRITAAKEGFHPAALSIAVDDSQPEWNVRFDLVPQEHGAEEITVYATRTDRRLQDLPTRVEVLAREEIEEKMLMTPGDITMMLNETGGLRVQTTSPSLGAASIRIQGMRGRYTRFLSDGLPLFGQQGGGLGILQIPPMDLGQVEVIKGTASALYGAGAMGGVVNLVSRRIEDKPVHDVLVNRSTLGATDATAFLGSKLSDNWSGSVLAGGHWQERRDLDRDDWADLAGYSRGLIRPRFFWDSESGRTAFVTAGVMHENRRGGTMPDRALRQTGAPYVEALDTTRYDFGTVLQAAIGPSLVLTARVAGSSQNHNHLFGTVAERDRHEMVFGELSARGTLRNHTWVLGTAVERDSYVPRNVPQFRYLYVTPGVFLQDDIDVASWLSVSASARADFHNRYGTFFSPRLAALFRWEGWTSRVSVGQGFFAPTPLTEETEAAGLTRLYIPVPLLAERGRSASFDVTRTVGAASYTVTLFRSSIRNPVYVNRSARWYATEAPTRYELRNLANPTDNTGLELLGTLRKREVFLTGSYAYVRSREGGGPDVPLTPRHSAGAVGMWEKEDAGRIGLECYYTGRQRLEENPFRLLSKPYVIVGALVERHVGALRLFFNAENLTDVRQTRWDPLLRPNRGVDGRWTVDAWAPLEGRVFNGGVRWVF